MKYFLTIIFIILSCDVFSQVPASPSHLNTLGTRSWIRLTWQDNAGNETGYNIYWSLTGTKPSTPQAVLAANSTRYYISGVTSLTAYTIWVEAFNNNGKSTALTGSVTTIRTWSLDSAEANNLSIPSSVAVPSGMQLFWQDEFNDALLNRNKWSTNYYSTIDYKNGTDSNAFHNDTLAQPAITMTGSSLKLIINDSMPSKAFWPTRKISSIQTYDWHSNERYLDDKRGGYYEVRVKRSNTSGATNGLNAAYWFDSPGPDLKYYMEQGQTYNGVAGVRPHGQAFEIDVFEEDDDAASSTTTPFTLHGNVASDGSFQSHLDTYNATLSGQTNWVTHGLLWTPSGISYYINGVLKKAWNSSTANMAPNHFMNILLGNYYGWTKEMTNNAMMEVDYIRGYQWPIINGNELPNPGFEYGTLFPWKGTGTLSASAKKTGNAGLVLAAGQSITQNVFLDNGNNYQLTYWAEGTGTLSAQAVNIAQVSGGIPSTFLNTTPLTSPSAFVLSSLDLAAGSEFSDHMRTVKVTFSNTGTGSIRIDDIGLTKGGTGGNPIVCSPAGGTHACLHSHHVCP